MVVFSYFLFFYFVYIDLNNDVIMSSDLHHFYQQKKQLLLTFLPVFNIFFPLAALKMIPFITGFSQFDCCVPRCDFSSCLFCFLKLFLDLWVHSFHHLGIFQKVCFKYLLCYLIFSGTQIICYLYYVIGH